MPVVGTPVAAEVPPGGRVVTPVTGPPGPEPAQIVSNSLMLEAIVALMGCKQVAQAATFDPAASTIPQ